MPPRYDHGCSARGARDARGRGGQGCTPKPVLRRGHRCPDARDCESCRGDPLGYADPSRSSLEGIGAPPEGAAPHPGAITPGFHLYVDPHARASMPPTNDLHPSVGPRRPAPDPSSFTSGPDPIPSRGASMPLCGAPPNVHGSPSKETTSIRVVQRGQRSPPRTTSRGACPRCDRSHGQALYGRSDLAQSATSCGSSPDPRLGNTVCLRITPSRVNPAFSSTRSDAP